MKNEKNTTLLIQKYLESKCTPDELKSIIHLLEKEEYEDQLHVLLFDYWKNTPSFQHQIEKEELDQMLNSIHHQISLTEREEKPLIKRVLYYAIRTAAILFIPLLLASLWVFFRDDTYNQGDSYITLETPMGSKLRTTLPDGTEVWQNSGTTLQYPVRFTKHHREVRLSGEAYFHVSSDKKNPFFVKTDDGTIKVTGTRFNVSAFPDDHFSSVVLEEGQVFYLPANQEKPVILYPNERIIYLKDQHKLIRGKTDVEKYTSWKEGKLIFRNDPLSDIIRRLKRWYNADIVLSDPSEKLGGLTFTMTIENETLPQVIDYITQAANLNLKRKDLDKNTEGSFVKTKYIIYKKNKKEDAYVK